MPVLTRGASVLQEFSSRRSAGGRGGESAATEVATPSDESPSTEEIAVVTDAQLSLSAAELFARYDVDQSGELDPDEFRPFLIEIVREWGVGWNWGNAALAHTSRRRWLLLECRGPRTTRFARRWRSSI
jgi:hypothetical protein